MPLFTSLWFYPWFNQASGFFQSVWVDQITKTGAWVRRQKTKLKQIQPRTSGAAKLLKHECGLYVRLNRNGSRQGRRKEAVSIIQMIDNEGQAAFRVDRWLWCGASVTGKTGS